MPQHIPCCLAFYRVLQTVNDKCRCARGACTPRSHPLSPFLPFLSVWPLCGIFVNSKSMRQTDRKTDNQRNGCNTRRGRPLEAASAASLFQFPVAQKYATCLNAQIKKKNRREYLEKEGKVKENEEKSKRRAGKKQTQKCLTSANKTWNLRRLRRLHTTHTCTCDWQTKKENRSQCSDSDGLGRCPANCIQKRKLENKFFCIKSFDRYR